MVEHKYNTQDTAKISGCSICDAFGSAAGSAADNGKKHFLEVAF